MFVHGNRRGGLLLLMAMGYLKIPYFGRDAEASVEEDDFVCLGVYGLTSEEDDLRCGDEGRFAFGNEIPR